MKEIFERIDEILIKYPDALETGHNVELAYSISKNNLGVAVKIIKLYKLCRKLFPTAIPIGLIASGVLISTFYYDSNGILFGLGVLGVVYATVIIVFLTDGFFKELVKTFDENIRLHKELLQYKEWLKNMEGLLGEEILSLVDASSENKVVQITTKSHDNVDIPFGACKPVDNKVTANISNINDYLGDVEFDLLNSVMLFKILGDKVSYKTNKKVGDIKDDK